MKLLLYYENMLNVVFWYFSSSGNQIEKLAGDIMSRMKYAKKVDLRMNQLTLPPSETVKFVALEHLTHLDIRDNKVPWYSIGDEDFFVLCGYIILCEFQLEVDSAT
jgi:hypothetical protein